MFGPIRAVLVDDTPSHLFNISTGLSAAGIPCTPYWYDRDEISPSKKLKPSPPVGGHEYLRVIFSDLNLEEKAGNLAEAIAPAINVVEQLVSKNHGPYAVVFWTVMSFDIADIRNELMSRLEAIDVAAPIAVDEIEKGKFLSIPSDEHTGEEVLNELYKHTHDNVDALRNEVIKVMSKYDLLQMLSEWESRAMHAAGRSTNNLFAAAKLQENSHSDLSGAMINVSAMVAKETAGPAAAMADPAKAYDAAMQDVLVDSFSASINEFGYRDRVANVLNDTIRGKVNVTNKELVNANLNSMFHLDKNVDTASVMDRGSVITLIEAKKVGIGCGIDNYCCREDFFWDPQERNIAPAFPKLTETIKSNIARKVVELDAKAVGTVNDAINQLRQEWNNTQKSKYDALKKNEYSFIGSLRWLLIEVGADCDHAQSKPRSMRYLVAVEVPAEHIAEYVYGGVRKSLRNEALRNLGPYCVDGESKYLLVSLKRFVVWQPPSNPSKIKIEFRLRKSLVDYLLSNYSAWSMRPGIIEFR